VQLLMVHTSHIAASGKQSRTRQSAFAWQLKVLQDLLFLVLLVFLFCPRPLHVPTTPHKQHVARLLICHSHVCGIWGGA
jgi:hypothetical protein